MTVDERLDQENRHLHLYRGQPFPYHHTIAGLCCIYATANADILDLGCARGEVSILVKKNLPSAPIFIADAYQCWHGVQQQLEMERSYLLSESSFDVIGNIDRRLSIIAMSDVFEHLHDPVRALRDVMSLAQPGGHLVLVVPNPARPEVPVYGHFRHHYVYPGRLVASEQPHLINFLANIMKPGIAEYASGYIAFPKLRTIEGCGVFSVILSRWWPFSNKALIEAPDPGRRDAFCTGL